MVKIAFQIKRSASDAKLQRTAVIGRCMPRLIAQIALRPLCPSPAFFQPEQHRGQKRVQRRLTGFVFSIYNVDPRGKIHGSICQLSKAKNCGSVNLHVCPILCSLSYFRHSVSSHSRAAHSHRTPVPLRCRRPVLFFAYCVCIPQVSNPRAPPAASRNRNPAPSGL